MIKNLKGNSLFERVHRRSMRRPAGAYLEKSDPASVYNPTASRLTHVASFTSMGNAGDVLLPIATRDLFESVAGPLDWYGRHVHHPMTPEALNPVNRTLGCIVGGGGLFLRDTNANTVSGWQWPCPRDLYKQIDIPLALFGVGYNRFRGQKDFEEIFAQNITELTAKAEFIGLRNHGSIRSFSEYLPDHLKAKVRYQPCPTTVIRRLYPDWIPSGIDREDIIGVNMAFDRSGLRYGESMFSRVEAFCRAVKECARGRKVRYLAHVPGDEACLPFFDALSIPVEVLRLYKMSCRDIVEAYAQVRVVIGMRGHAQLVAFGCGTPCVSVISHDKIRWFLEDIDRLNWGLEVADTQLTERIVERVQDLLIREEHVRSDLDAIQDDLHRVSVQNVRDFLKACNIPELGMVS